MIFHVQKISSHSCTVNEFLCNIFGKESQLFEEFKNSYQLPILDARIGFTHFIQVHYTPNLEDLEKIVRRRAAISLKGGEKGVDLIIPVVFPNNAIGTLLFQVNVNNNFLILFRLTIGKEDK